VQPARSDNHAADNMPEFVYLLVNYPALIVVPIVVFAGFALWSSSRTAWIATAAWIAYLAYEIGMKTGAFCSGEGCIRRSELYFVYPVLTFVSLVALVQVYVHLRETRVRRPRPNLAR
jgi:hypothetical protein